MRGGSAVLEGVRPQTRGNAFLARLERIAPLLLTLGLLFWTVVVFAASVYKYESFGQGYDQVDFEQAVWNTLQGRPMEDSRFNFTDRRHGGAWYSGSLA